MEDRQIKLMQGLLTDFRDDLSKSLSRQTASNALTTKYLDLLSHQLRTPLSAIRLNLEMLLEEGNVDGDLQEVISEMLLLAKSMTLTLNDIVLAQEIEKGSLVLHREEVDVDELIQALIENYKLELSKKKLKVDFKKEGATTRFSLDKDKFQTVLEQLLMNAILYSKEEGHIEISLKMLDKELLLELSDEGVGIPLKDQEFLFDRFFRGENAIKMVPDRTGLGLYIAGHFVQMHGGRLEINSEEGKGTRVRLHLDV